MSGIGENKGSAGRDGAYDRKDARNAIRKRGARPLIPPPRNAKFKRGDGLERDQALLEIADFGGSVEGRSLWGKFDWV